MKHCQEYFYMCKNNYISREEVAFYSNNLWRCYQESSERECLTAIAACTKSLHILEGINDIWTDNSVTDDRELLNAFDRC